MKTWLVGLFVLLLTTACILPRHTCSLPAPCTTEKVFRLDPKFTADERLLVGQGFEAWHTASKGAICFKEGERGKGWNFVVLRVEDQAGLAPFDDDWGEHGAIQHLGLIAVAMDVSGAHLDSVIAHEAGHVLGYEHHSNPRSIMYHIAGQLNNGRLSAIDVQAYLTKP